MEKDNRFHTSVDSIFRVLLHEPFSIVDDTAMERLLDMLQHHCITTKQDDTFIQQCIAFWEDALIWQHETTLSFALRYCFWFIFKFLLPSSYTFPYHSHSNEICNVYLTVSIIHLANSLIFTTFLKLEFLVFTFDFTCFNNSTMI